MTFLADACALLDYFGTGGRTMTDAGRNAMQDGQTSVSPVTVWELTLKAGRGLIPPLPTRDGSFANDLAAIGFDEEPFLSVDAEIANGLPPLHRDPMDRMLIGTATRARLVIVTCDAIIRRYAVPTVW